MSALHSAKIILLSVLLMVAFPGTALYGQAAKWTVMVYLDADNDLEDAAIDDMNEMEMIGSSEEVNIIVQLDRINGYDATNENWADTRRFRIIQDVNESVISSPAIDLPGELNMGDPETLADFITWASENYPAENYALIVWNHGGGWYKTDADKEPGNELPPEKDVCYDNSSGDFLSNMELSDAISSTGADLDILAYDACLMGMIEVAYQSRNLVDIIIASEDLEPWDGYDYTGFLNDLIQNPDLSPGELSISIVSHYGAFYEDWVTLSAFRTSGVIKIAQKLDSLVDDLIRNNAVWESVGQAWNTAQRFSETPEYVDLGSWAKELGQLLIDEDLRADADSLFAAVAEARIAQFECEAYPEATGLTFYFPEEMDYDFEYEATGRDFSDSTNWVPFLHTFFQEFYLDLSEPNNHFATASAATSWNIDKGKLNDASDIDIYRIFYYDTGITTSEVSIDPPADFDLFLYQVADTSIVLMDSSVNPGLEQELISFQNRDTGYYFILLRPVETSDIIYELNYKGLDVYSSYDYNFGTPLTLAFDDGNPGSGFSALGSQNGIGMAVTVMGVINGVWYYVTHQNDTGEGMVYLDLYYPEYEEPVRGIDPIALEPDHTGWNYLDLTSYSVSGYGDEILFGLRWTAGSNMAIGTDSMPGFGASYIFWEDVWKASGDSLIGYIRPIISYPQSIQERCLCSELVELTAANGSFEDGSGASSYGNNCQCRWIIRPVGALSISVTINELDLEPEYDFLYVYDGEYPLEGNLLGIYNGSLENEQFVAGSGSMLLDFTSDGSIGYPGWSISYTADFAVSENLNGTMSTWTLFPNPGDGRMQLRKTKADVQETFLTLFSATGEQLTNIEISHGNEVLQLDFSRFAPGLYYLRINDQDSSVLIPYLLNP
ncbi:MAG: T9SS type A sorting domain-containing protein [Bacteroidales bacterium]|nr:T9SS type A sorting domain-containing protein [Bacteroidales bacterium]